MAWLWHLNEHLRQGGWVMVPLVGVSLVMWALIVDRGLRFRELDRDDLGVADAATALGADGPPPGRGLRARLVAELRAVRRGRLRTDLALLHTAADDLRRGYENHLRLIEVLAAVAPLLGLLGTVLGMIQTFDVISTFGTGNPRALASGISVALITTQSGLLVAIPGLFAAGRLRRAAAVHTLRLDETVVVLARALDADPEASR
jgi:biopolymer transport protein ExbB